MIKKIGIILLGIILLTGCNKKEKEKERVEGYEEKIAILEKQDGWYYTFTTNKNEFGKLDYFFEGINLKYVYLDNYYIYLRDSTTNEVIDKIKAYPSLSTSEYGDVIKERDEVIIVNNYFNDKQFNRQITISDLKELELVNFDKNDIVKLHNETFLYVPKAIDDFGKFKLPVSMVYESYKLESGYWSIGQLGSYGYLKIINIDFIFTDGTRLKDLILNKTASEDQIKMHNYIVNIEKQIINKQDLLIENDGSLDKFKFESLYTTLKGMPNAK